MSFIQAIEEARVAISARTAASKKADFGQFLTPAATARFMSNLFWRDGVRNCRLLDPGAGIGSLSAAFLDHWYHHGLDFESVDVTAYEVDDTLHTDLRRNIAAFSDHLNASLVVLGEDFIESSVNAIQFRTDAGFTHAILNPPYKKINSASRHRLLLRQVGIETVNLYSAFVALSLLRLVPGGQLVAIIPRSFCNGPYYRPFRRLLLSEAAIRHIHLFSTRDRAFRDDQVLQENVILSVERGGEQRTVRVTTSADDGFQDLVEHEYAFERIVVPGDQEQFLHIPTSPARLAVDRSTAFGASLSDLGLEVSTGPVVDFRLRDHISRIPEPDSVPLLYPTHFSMSKVNWPKPDSKKPDSIKNNSATRKWLFPAGCYCVVKRFTSKEEQRRLVATVLTSEQFEDFSFLGFENHLNIIHFEKQGIPEVLARGIAAFLNSTAADEHFRVFNGHTQVNATDLRLMRYPSRDVIVALGSWVMSRETVAQAELDTKLKELTDGTGSEEPQD